MAINWECDVLWSNGARTVGVGDTESEARSKLDQRVRAEPFNNGTTTITRSVQCRFIGSSPSPSPSPSPTPTPTPSPSNARYSFVSKFTTPLGSTNNGLWNFKYADRPQELYGVLRRGASGKTEIHMMRASDNYQNFSIQTATALPPTDNDLWDFAVNNSGDLICILRKGASGKTEVHILSRASNYQNFSVHTATALPPTDNDLWDFAVNYLGDIFAILKKGSSGKTEIHELRGISNYQIFHQHVATALQATNNSLWEFAGANSVDLFSVLKNSASGMTELYVVNPNYE